VKEDSAFHLKARDWKVTQKQPSYYENFDKIFRKKYCMYCGNEVEIINPEDFRYGSKNKIICFDCYGIFFNEACNDNGKEYFNRRFINKFIDESK